MFSKSDPKQPQQFFHLKSDVFQKSQIVAVIFGLLLQLNLSPQLFKKGPIWSHCDIPAEGEDSWCHSIRTSSSDGGGAGQVAIL